MSEFAVAMIAFVPLRLGVIYIGKYSTSSPGDPGQPLRGLRARARSASHEGAPRSRTKPLPLLQDGGQHTIGFQDKATGLTRSDENPVWASGQRQPDDRTVPGRLGPVLVSRSRTRRRLR